jgi:ribosomal protein L37E
MAYVECARCGLIAFTAAYWSSTDYCGRCGAELPRPRRSAEPISRHPRFLKERWRPPPGSRPADIVRPAP